MSQKFLIPPRTTDGNEIRKFFQKVCQLINQGMEVGNSIVRAYLTADQAINHATPTVVVGYTKLLDIGNNFNAATGIYTAPVTGKYHVDYTVFYADAQSKLTFCTSYVSYNNVASSIGSTWSGTDKASVSSSGSDILSVVAGGTLKLSGSMQTSDSSAAIMYNGVYTKLAVHLITRD